MGKEKVHFEAPHHDKVQEEMNLLLNWIKNEKDIDLVIKSAIIHFWFIIIHPFDDGNGRIARALTDLLLAKSEQSSLRFYSLSNQILTEKKITIGEFDHGRKDVTSDLQEDSRMSRQALGPREPKQELFPPWLPIMTTWEEISSSPKNDVSLTRPQAVRSEWFQLVMDNARESFFVQLAT